MGNTVVGCFASSRAGHRSAFYLEPLEEEELGHSFCYVHAPSSISSSLSHEFLTPYEYFHMAGMETLFTSISGASVSANASRLRFDTPSFESSSSFSSLPLHPMHMGSMISGPLERSFMSGPLERASILEEAVANHVHFSAPLTTSTNPLKITSSSSFPSLQPHPTTIALMKSTPVDQGFMLGSSEEAVADHIHFSAPLTTSTNPLKRTLSSFPSLRFHSKPTALTISSPINRGFMSGHLEEAVADRIHSSVPLTTSSNPLKKAISKMFKSSSFTCRPLHPMISSPIERGFMSGPLEEARADHTHFSAPLTTSTHPLKKAISKMLSASTKHHSSRNKAKPLHSSIPKTPQWAQISAGEDRIHIALSEHHGWLFVGIYDGFNGPGATDFLTSTLFRSISNQLHKLLYDKEEEEECHKSQDEKALNTILNRDNKSHRIWAMKRLFSRRTTRAFRDKKENHHRKLFPCRCDLEQPKKDSEKMSEEKKTLKHDEGSHQPQAVLKALAHALEATEAAYLDMVDRALEENPELALMGSCVLVMLMKGKDVYVMNVGDSRAILAQQSNDSDEIDKIGSKVELEQIVEEIPKEFEPVELCCGPPSSSPTLDALQLSTDHSTSIEEEVLRIRAEHPNDASSVFNDRVKGKLSVTRAFGAGFLKKPQWNSALLERFRVDYVGTSPYITCTPFLSYHRLGPRDRFLVLSSDGLYQYFTNQEVVSHVECFMDKYPDSDPAQHLIEQLLFRAAQKAGIDFHELLEIPRGDRRKYHDDVSVIVISLNRQN